MASAVEITELTGTTLGGRVELQDVLGEGGYGAVFRAVQLSVGRPCAVKVVSPDITSAPDAVERFRVEAEATSKLADPHTVTLYDFGQDESTSMLFLVMELLEGRSLREFAENHAPLSLETVGDILGQAACSLQEAHDIDLVHRDVKPSNVMLVERSGTDRFVKIIDFGIAKALRADFQTETDLTQTGTMVGTPNYMAPEQIRADGIGPAVDQYALAMVAYMLASGRTPFEEGTAMEVASRHLQERPEPLSEFRRAGDVPERVDRILLRATAKDPADRFPSIRDFADAFAEAVDMERVDTLPRSRDDSSAPGSTETVPRSAEQRRRRWRLAVAICVGLALLTGLAGGVLYLVWNQEGRAGVAGGAVDELADVDSSAATTVVANVGSARRDGGAAPEDSVAASETAAPVERDAGERDGAADIREDVETPSGSAPATASRDAASGSGDDEEPGASPDEERRKRPRRGSLEVRMVPWGTLFIDGERIDRGSRVEQQLRAGRYDLEMRQNGEVVEERSVRVAPGDALDVNMVAR